MNHNCRLSAQFSLPEIAISDSKSAHHPLGQQALLKLTLELQNHRSGICLAVADLQIACAVAVANGIELGGKTGVAKGLGGRRRSQHCRR